ncbi:transcriptional regulator, LacI family [Caldicellulosiruptor owensensis OL]|uniref:Transcriptional regulator, LacI family n=1 Tax=Caldicellulosiruptor owensensis (strain ATCC 700167 / DSM 13100 / OL) TaxID=632518 RepID=E4Q3G0_CALOW|nr:LacI family DNA-binding transcriptional regulator [Caldicellulosiruptor owensensis]ADQ03920.1 transcriptional regulator, LacI family [Caldicellulosiruptor owensensis OL]
MKVRIKDIAKAVGVSPATVSLVLNNRPGISEETREKILKKIEELGYNSGRTTSKAVRGLTKNIRFIVYKKHGKVVGETPFFSALIEGIEQEARDEGFNLLISYINEQSGDRQEIIQIIKETPVDGILLLATEMYSHDLLIFNNLTLPIVVLDSYLEDKNMDFVVIANAEAIYSATVYLIQKGHREIGYLDSSVWIKNFEERKEGYEKAILQSGLVFKKEFILSLEPTLDGAYKDMKEILGNGTELPTAFVAANDIIAFGAMKALKEAGIKIPDDISIIGLDDMPFCEICDPPITTLRVYKERMGKIAVKRLIERIMNNVEERVKIEVRTELIERKSVKDNMLY